MPSWQKLKAEFCPPLFEMWRTFRPKLKFPAFRDCLSCKIFLGVYLSGYFQNFPEPNTFGLKLLISIMTKILLFKNLSNHLFISPINPTRPYIRLIRCIHKYERWFQSLQDKYLLVHPLVSELSSSSSTPVLFY